jgi:TetR/AcrR family transcriptional repressor of mexJK operon
MDPTLETREDAKESKILAAAFEMFLDLGYAGTSMDLVAQRARASKTTLYTRFPSKEALFAATISAACQRRMSFEAHALSSLPVEEALIRIARQFLDLIYSPEALRMEQILTGEATRFPEAAQIFYQAGPARVREAVARYFETASERGLLRVEDPVFAAGQFLAAMKGMPHCELMMSVRPPPAPDEREAFIAKAVTLFLEGAGR